MCRHSLGLSSALQHKELGKDSDGLEPDRKGPGDFQECVLVREKESQNSSGSEQVFDVECVEVGVVSWLVSPRHEIDDVKLGGDEEDLEDEVVGGRGPRKICNSGRLVIVS